MLKFSPHEELIYDPESFTSGKAHLEFILEICRIVGKHADFFVKTWNYENDAVNEFAKDVLSWMPTTEDGIPEVMDENIIARAKAALAKEHELVSKVFTTSARSNPTTAASSSSASIDDDNLVARSSETSNPIASTPSASQSSTISPPTLATSISTYSPPTIPPPNRPTTHLLSTSPSKSRNASSISNPTAGGSNPPLPPPLATSQSAPPMPRVPSSAARRPLRRHGALACILTSPLKSPLVYGRDDVPPYRSSAFHAPRPSFSFPLARDGGAGRRAKQEEEEAEVAEILEGEEGDGGGDEEGGDNMDLDGGADDRGDKKQDGQIDKKDERVDGDGVLERLELGPKPAAEPVNRNRPRQKSEVTRYENAEMKDAKGEGKKKGKGADKKGKGREKKGEEVHQMEEEKLEKSRSKGKGKAKAEGSTKKEEEDSAKTRIQALRRGRSRGKATEIEQPEVASSKIVGPKEAEESAVSSAKDMGKKRARVETDGDEEQDKKEIRPTKRLRRSKKAEA
ncbi:hypothetical protein AX16_003365 [Volvariella volvacea WC 439]|nr:hypothetical protein AX16_003365 [Volvariella volvacea WC 439]